MKNLIHKILKEELEKKDIFVPHKVKERHDERTQDTINKLKQKYVKGDIFINHPGITDLGNIIEVDGDLEIDNNKIRDLGNLEYVSGNLILNYELIKDLNKLKKVGGNLNIANTFISSLGDLKEIGGHGIFRGNKYLKNLGHLEYVGYSLFLTDTNISDLGNLKEVGAVLSITNTPLSKKYTEDEIRSKVNVGGVIIK